MTKLDRLREDTQWHKDYGRYHAVLNTSPETVLALLDAVEALREAVKLDDAGWLMHPAVVAKARAALAALDKKDA